MTMWLRWSRAAVVLGFMAQMPALARSTTTLVEDARNLLSARCSCKSASDCTCKKGECSCSDCSSHRKSDRLTKANDETTSELPAPQPESPPTEARGGVSL